MVSPRQTKPGRYRPHYRHKLLYVKSPRIYLPIPLYMRSEVLVHLTGYDMQFDIKYAYFSFLQSLPYTLSVDPALCEMRNLELSLDKSSCNSEDESNTTDVN